MSINLADVSITQPRHHVNQHIHALIEHYKEPAYKLIRHLQTKYNAPLEEIGQVLGISKQAVQFQYLSKFPKKEEDTE